MRPPSVSRSVAGADWWTVGPSGHTGDRWFSANPSDVQGAPRRCPGVPGSPVEHQKGHSPMTEHLPAEHGDGESTRTPVPAETPSTDAAPALTDSTAPVEESDSSSAVGESSSPQPGIDPELSRLSTLDARAAGLAAGEPGPAQSDPPATPEPRSSEAGLTVPAVPEAGTTEPENAAPVAPTPTSPPTSPAGPGRPGGRPGGAPGRRNSARTGAATAVPGGEQVTEPTDPHKWGRIDEAGSVYVYGPTGERTVGNWQAGDAEAGLAHFARRFDDFATEIALLETRLATGSGDPKATKTHAIELRESVDTLAAIGDLDSAAARLEIVIGAADAAIAGASTARAAARATAVAAKEALCVEAESLAESEQWKATGDRLKEIVDEWRTVKGIDRKTDDALWKRFAKARDAFTRRRGTHFADLDKQRGAAREAKEVLIARAEALAESTEWGRTAGEYRTLMEEWKASGRAPREVEDALWGRFRAAQEKFFSHRNQTFSERDHEFEANAETKDRLLVEAEKINAADGLDSAKAALRSIQERWEAAGKVPRERIKEFDSRLRAIEDRIRSAEDSYWRRTDPETSARIEQFRSRAQGYRVQADKARAAGNERKAKEAETQALQWEEWLAAAEGVVEG